MQLAMNQRGIGIGTDKGGKLKSKIIDQTNYLSKLGTKPEQIDIRKRRVLQSNKL